MNTTENLNVAGANEASVETRVDTVVTGNDGVAVVVANTAVEDAGTEGGDTVVETTSEGAAEGTTSEAPAAAASDTPAPAADSAPAPQGGKKHKGKKHGKDRAPRVPQKTQLVKGEDFDTGVVNTWFQHSDRLLISVLKDGKEERGLLLPDGLKLDNVRGTTREQRAELALARLTAIKNGEEPVPALTVTEVGEKGARFTETARLDDIKKNAEFKAKREQRQSDIEVVRGMVGETVENAEIVGFATYRDGPRAGEAFGVFVRIRGDVDGMIHGSKVKGGFNRVKTLSLGDKLDTVTITAVKDVQRRGQDDIQVEVSEMASFPLSAGQVMRGAAFVKRNGNDMVYSWNGYDVYLGDQDRTVSETSLTKERGQKTNLTFKEVDGFGRIRAEKKGK